jgi:hypothetical protein
MSSLLAVDPGIDRCGLAVFESGKLVWAGHEGQVQKSSVDPLTRAVDTARAVRLALRMNDFELENFDEVVLEWPQIRMPGKSTTPGADILLLAAVDGAIASMTQGRLRAVHPSDWKGQMKNEVVVARVSGRLATDPRELAALDDAYKRVAASLRHNVTDACGIALWILKRMG